MGNYPKDLMELEKQFSTEADCIDYLYGLRWPNGFICPHCGHDKVWNMSSGLYRCASCKYRCSVTSGTIFEGTRTSLVLWFRAIWWVVSQKNGASAKGLQSVLGMNSYQTAWTWLHKLRRAMVRAGRDKLGGIVQVDESFIGGKKSGKRGRGAEGKSLVVIAAELKGKHIGRIRLNRVDNGSSKCLEKAIEQSVESGSNLQTDGWRGYNQINRLGYHREIIRPSEELGDNLLPQCHRVASLLKRWLLGTHQGAVSHEHLEYYLDEYTFRFNRRTSTSRGKLFYRLLQQAMTTQPTIYGNIVKNVKENRRAKR